MQFKRNMPASRGDINFFASTEAVQASFWCQFASYRFVSGPPMGPALGQGLCKFGRTTGQTCDTVHSFGSCRGEYCNLVSMANRKADRWDSGGPWYDGDRAVGIHSGRGCGVVCRDQFSYLREQIGPYLNVNLLN